MNKITRQFYLMILALLFSADLFAQSISIEMHWSGTFGPYAKHPPPNDPLPNVTLSPYGLIPRPLERTREIPAEAGTRFGILFTLHGSDEYAVKVRRIWHFPALGPNAQKDKSYESSRETVERCHIDLPCYIGYVFGPEEEILIGDWKMEIFVKDEKIHEEIFHIGQRLASNHSLQADVPDGPRPELKR